MHRQRLTASSSLVASLLALALAACSGGPEGATDTTTASTTATSSGSGGAGGAGAGDATATSSSSAGGASTVTFSYTPAWSGVTSVTVIGKFGKSTDWDPKNPFLKLTKDAKGTWSGSAELPAGTYPYLFQAIGDDAADPSKPPPAQFVVDPLVTGTVACPAESPTYITAAPNPCSQRTLPETGAAPPVYHVKGVVRYDKKPVAGYFVELNRFEDGQHHFFENQMVTGADGAFDLATTTAKIRVQVVHPTFETKNDAERDPIALAAFRIMTSASFPVSADVDLATVDTSYHEYEKLAPTGAAPALPTTFHLSLVPGASAARILGNITPA